MGSGEAGYGRLKRDSPANESSQSSMRRVRIGQVSPFGSVVVGERGPRGPRFLRNSGGLVETDGLGLVSADVSDTPPGSSSGASVGRKGSESLAYADGGRVSDGVFRFRRASGNC